MEREGKRKEKILFCVTKSNWGGAQRYVYDLASNLSPENYEVAVVLGGDGMLKEKLKEVGIRTISMKSLQRDVEIIKDISSFFELVRIFRKEKPDIIHLNSSKMGGLGGLTGRIARIKKIIFTAHGWAYNEERGLSQRMAVAILHFFTVFLSSLTIVVSQKAKDQFIGKSFLSKKMILIHNGIGEIEFMEKEKARQQFVDIRLPQTEKVKEKIKSEPLWIGTISELHKNKGLRYAIEAVVKIIGESDGSEARFRNIIFIIIGEGEERKNLEKIIAKNNIENSVFLVGNVKDASCYIKALDIFTLTSITEALPYAVLEAGKARVPIIASNVGGISEIIDDMRTGILIPPKKPKEIIDAIEYLINQPDKREDFPILLKEKIDKEFGLDTMIAKTIEVYTRD